MQRKRLRPTRQQSVPKPSTAAPPTNPSVQPQVQPDEPQPQTPSNQPKHEEPVYLNVYDLTRINEFTKNLGLGVYHTGVEVYGAEYCFAGHRSHHTGIYRMSPRNEAELNDSCLFNRSIHLGNTTLTPQEVNELITDLGQYFRGHYYHLTSFNCNHFSNAFTQLLCGHKIPGWVNRVANIVTIFPILKRLLPKDAIRPPKHKRYCRHQLSATVTQNQNENERQNANHDQNQRKRCHTR